MRFVVFILLIQFATPAFAQGNAQENAFQGKVSYKIQQADSNILLNVILKEDSEEKSETDDKAEFLSAELIDFTFLTTVLTHNHSRFDWDTSKLPLTQEPLFKLNCTFLL